MFNTIYLGNNNRNKFKFNKKYFKIIFIRIIEEIMFKKNN